MRWEISKFARNKIIFLIIVWLAVSYYFYYIHFDKLTLILFSIIFPVVIFTILKNPQKWEKGYKTKKAGKLRKKIRSHYFIKYPLVMLGVFAIAYLLIIQGIRNLGWFLGGIIAYFIALYFLFKFLKI